MDFRFSRRISEIKVHEKRGVCVLQEKKNYHTSSCVETSVGFVYLRSKNLKKDGHLK